MITQTEKPDVPLADWIAEHEVCWEIGPLLERVKGRGVEQTGHAVRLFARFNLGAGDTEAVARPIHERLGRLALEAVQSLSLHMLVQVEPPGRAVVTPGDPFVVEVLLTLVASPPDPGHPLPADEVRRLIALVGTKLRSMGIKKRG